MEYAHQVWRNINNKKILEALLCKTRKKYWTFFVIEGNCTCNDGYGGSDCSFDVLSPPTITRLSGDGVCDKSSESCDDITLYGNYFLENMRTSCFVTREEVKYATFLH